MLSTEQQTWIVAESVKCTPIKTVKRKYERDAFPRSGGITMPTVKYYYYEKKEEF